MNAIEITLTCEPELDGPEGYFAMGAEDRTCADCEGRGTILSPGGSYLTGGWDTCETCGESGIITVDLDAEMVAEINEASEWNEWAWCCAKVTARYGSFEGTDYLGGCSYKSAADFMTPGGYYADMVAAALDDLKLSVKQARKDARGFDKALASALEVPA